MNKQQIELLQRMFTKVEPVAQEAGELFYGRLFDMDPSLRPLFKGDMKTQARMLMTAIGLAVQGLDHPEVVTPQLAHIGQRHVTYGAMPADFDKFGAALQWALAQTLGDDFTQPVREAWGEAFKFITQGMKTATN
jgi:hemoglobin-like flavoprotein